MTDVPPPLDIPPRDSPTSADLLPEALTAPPEDLPLVANPVAINRAVGYIALFLPLLLIASAWATGICGGQVFLDSLSHHYYAPLGGSIFVGALFTIGILMVALLRRKANAPDPLEPRHTVPVVADGFANFTTWDMIRVRIAGLAAFAVALLPAKGTGCEAGSALLRGFAQLPPDPLDSTYRGTAAETVPVWFDFWRVFGIENTAADAAHALAAGLMFAILGYMSFVVFTRVQSPDALRAGHRGGGAPFTVQKRIRNAIYRLCGATIFASIAILGLNALILPDTSGPALWFDAWNGVFVFETAALAAFGVSWLVKGRFVRWLNDPETRRKRHLAPQPAPPS